MRMEEHAGPDLSHKELDQRDQDYRAELDHNQRPSNIIMLRMLPPSATANEVRICLNNGQLMRRLFVKSLKLEFSFVHRFVHNFKSRGSSRERFA